MTEILRHFLQLYQNIFCTIDVILLDIANVFQIWSTQAGYKRISWGIWVHQVNILNNPVCAIESSLEQLVPDSLV